MSSESISIPSPDSYDTVSVFGSNGLNHLATESMTNALKSKSVIASTRKSVQSTCTGNPVLRASYVQERHPAPLMSRTSTRAPRLHSRTSRCDIPLHAVNIERFILFVAFESFSYKA